MGPDDLLLQEQVYCKRTARCSQLTAAGLDADVTCHLTCVSDSSLFSNSHESITAPDAPELSMEGRT